MTYSMSSQEAMALMMGDRLSEEHLSERFSRLEKAPQAIAYGITDDIGLLHQYYLLREAGQDGFDAVSDIAVARIGRQTIAGCRMTVSKGHQLPAGKIIPLTEALPELADEMHIELSRPAILPDFQAEIVLVELMRMLVERGIDMGARHAVALAPVPLASTFRKMAELFGLRWSIHNNEIPANGYEANLALYTLDLATVARPQAKRSAKAAQLTDA